MGKFDEGIKLFEKNDIKNSYDFRMEYGRGNLTILPTWEERAKERTPKKEPQTDIREYLADYLTNNESRLRMIRYVIDLINKTTLEKELKEKNMAFDIAVTIFGTPSTPMPLSPSDIDYDHYVFLDKI